MEESYNIKVLLCFTYVFKSNFKGKTVSRLQSVKSNTWTLQITTLPSVSAFKKVSYVYLQCCQPCMHLEINIVKFRLGTLRGYTLFFCVPFLFFFFLGVLGGFFFFFCFSFFFFFFFLVFCLLGLSPWHMEVPEL